MGLEDQWYAFHGRGVGAFAAFGQTLLSQALRIGQRSDPLAGVTLSAPIVRKPFAVGGLREQPRQRELTYTMRPGKQQGMGHPAGTERAPERGDDLLIAAKFGESHGQRFS
jgi:hypothetical protein